MPSSGLKRESIRVKGDTPPFGLRLPEDLRAALEREKEINGRSLNAEILARLRSTFEPHDPTKTARQPDASYETISDTDRTMLAIFHRLSVEKQLALISLFK